MCYRAEFGRCQTIGISSERTGAYKHAPPIVGFYHAEFVRIGQMVQSCVCHMSLPSLKDRRQPRHDVSYLSNILLSPRP